MADRSSLDEHAHADQKIMSPTSIHKTILEKPSRRRWFPVVVWSAAIMFASAFGLMLIIGLFFEFTLESQMAAVDHSARIQSLRRDRDNVEQRLLRSEPFHGKMLVAAWERIDIAKFRTLSLWRGLRYSMVLRVLLVVFAVIAYCSALAGWRRARWAIFSTAILMLACSGFEAWALNRDLPRFSASFVRDMRIKHQEIQDEVEYRVTLPGIESVDAAKSRDLSIAWFVLTSLPWQILALLSAMALLGPRNRPKARLNTVNSEDLVEEKLEFIEPITLEDPA